MEIRCHFTSAKRCVLAMLLMFSAVATSPVWAQGPKGISGAPEAKTGAAPNNRSNDEVAALKGQLAQQQKQIEQLRLTLEAFKQRLDQPGAFHRPPLPRCQTLAKWPPPAR
jgi:hypothetical protein